jgi:multiple sugar transport system permease protein
MSRSGAGASVMRTEASPLRPARSSGPLGPTRGQRLLTHLVLLALCVPFALPLVWMVATSLKPETEIYTTEAPANAWQYLVSIFPSQPRWENYPEALRTVPFAVYLRNTLLLCVANVLFAVASSAVVAYGFARLRFPGRDLLFMVMISTMALPGQVTMIPVFTLFRELGLYGTFAPLIVPALFGNAFFIFLLRQFFRTIPEELAEAARVDGAGEWTIFWRIMLPLAKPALATCALFQFLGTWNDLFGPLLYLNDPQRYTLAYGLQQFMSSYGGKWAQLMAGACIFTLPIVVLFFFAQRTFIQGISTTGSKS